MQTLRTNGKKRAVVPKQFQKGILEENRSGGMEGHFAVSCLYAALSCSWWWEGMYTDVYKYCCGLSKVCHCYGGGRKSKPLLHLIPVQRLFQIIRVDVLELPKWKQVCNSFPRLPTQPQIRRQFELLIFWLMKLCPCLVSQRLRSWDQLVILLNEGCLQILWQQKATAYHPKCNGMVERFNRTS